MTVKKQYPLSVVVCRNTIAACNSSGVLVWTWLTGRPRPQLLPCCPLLGRPRRRFLQYPSGDFLQHKGRHRLFDFAGTHNAPTNGQRRETNVRKEDQPKAGRLKRGADGVSREHKRTIGTVRDYPEKSKKLQDVLARLRLNVNVDGPTELTSITMKEAVEHYKCHEFQGHDRRLYYMQAVGPQKREAQSNLVRLVRKGFDSEAKSS